jgi:7,8-dihydropterin-6-yl-methyl-4-(beta-D-ribofuranosyl)aminobenzene 5'-phosphate synthase
LINEAKQAKGLAGGLSVDLHPSRPDYRGMVIGQKIISLQADPTFEEIEAAGAVVDKHGEAHTVLDDFFFVSGEIPRQTAYENGLKHGMRFSQEDNDWFSDELIADERFLMCNLKGMVMYKLTYCTVDADCSRERNRHVHRLQPCWSGQRSQACRRMSGWFCSSSCGCGRLPPGH